MTNKYASDKLGRRIATDVEIDITDGSFGGGSTVLDLKCDFAEINPNEAALPTSAVAMICGDKYVFSDADENVDTIDTMAIYTDGVAPSDVWAQLRAVKGQVVGLRYWPRGKTAGNRYHTIVGPLTQVSPPGIPKSGGVFYNVQIAGTFDDGGVQA